MKGIDDQAEELFLEVETYVVDNLAISTSDIQLKLQDMEILREGIGQNQDKVLEGWVDHLKTKLRLREVRGVSRDYLYSDAEQLGEDGIAGDIRAYQGALWVCSQGKNRSVNINGLRQYLDHKYKMGEKRIDEIIERLTMPD